MSQRKGRRSLCKSGGAASEKRVPGATKTARRPLFHLVKNLHLWPVAAKGDVPGGWCGVAILDLPDGRRLRIEADKPHTTPRAVVDTLGTLVGDALDAVVEHEQAKLQKAQEAFALGLGQFNAWRNSDA